MSKRVSENIILCIDTSRSMYRTDYAPSRLKCSIGALKKLVHQRLQEDSSSAFAIVSFKDKAKKELDFTALTDLINSTLDNLDYGGNSALGDALGLSIKLIIEELRKVAAKTPRILVVSDGNYTQTAIDPMKMARLAQGLGIRIDAFKLGEISVSNLNILKRVSEATKGKYYYNNDKPSLISASQDFANSNVKTYGKTEKSIVENPNFLRKIAANLLRVQDLSKSQEIKIKQLRGEADFKKCSICFQENDPVTKGSFFLTGRYCPNCNASFHIHCLAGWADSQEDPKMKQAGTVRCPHCFYLLKIPPEVTQAQKLKALTSLQGSSKSNAKKPEQFEAILENITDLGDEALYNSCPYCNMIFESNQGVIRCTNCSNLYHIKCFQKLEEGRCKICGVKLKLQ
ncbi:MAG: VWA domain-containing protein [Candidatus Lokiarchaeota archaeon]|nr:VWA domain-containing protein [Candidatus Lokiarchaeota archaeon]MBD3338331.1 VWA domain-containing protein [Candidatus Lokiarchaeota archaeon]